MTAHSLLIPEPMYADLTVAMFAGSISDKLRTNPHLQRRQRVASGVGMIGLGVFVGFSGHPRPDKHQRHRRSV
jgi:threonine/homoserine/homoserine lactone efflux protein